MRIGSKPACASNLSASRPRTRSKPSGSGFKPDPQLHRVQYNRRCGGITPALHRHLQLIVTPIHLIGLKLALQPLTLLRVAVRVGRRPILRPLPR